MKCDELEKLRYAPAMMQNGAGQRIAVMSESPKGMWLHYGDVMESITELKNVVGGVLNMRMNGLTVNDLFRCLWIARYERNLFLASVTHCQGSMNWRNEKLQAKLYVRAAKLLSASEKCKAYADKFKEGK